MRRLNFWSLWIQWKTRSFRGVRGSLFVLEMCVHCWFFFCWEGTQVPRTTYMREIGLWICFNFGGAHENHSTIAAWLRKTISNMFCNIYTQKKSNNHVFDLFIWCNVALGPRFCSVQLFSSPFNSILFFSVQFQFVAHA